MHLNYIRNPLSYQLFSFFLILLVLLSVALPTFFLFSCFCWYFFLSFYQLFLFILVFIGIYFCCFTNFSPFSCFCWYLTLLIYQLFLFFLFLLVFLIEIRSPLSSLHCILLNLALPHKKSFAKCETLSFYLVI